MEKLKNNILNIIVVSIFIMGSMFSSCTNKYIYNEQLNKVLDIKKIEIKNKDVCESGAIGEWYICETYELDGESINSFLNGNKNNILFSSNNLWERANWSKLPIDSIYNDAKIMVMNYRATKTIENKIKEMEETLSSNIGYYSFLCQPSFEAPQQIIFFLLNEKSNKLFVVDVKI